MATKPSRVNPKMIKHARESWGLTFEQIEYFHKKYLKWETGEETPSWDDLRLIAKFYKKPTFYYFLEKPIDSELNEDKDLLEIIDNLEGNLTEFKKEVLSRLDIIGEVKLKDI